MSHPAIKFRCLLPLMIAAAIAQQASAAWMLNPTTTAPDGTISTGTSYAQLGQQVAGNSLCWIKISEISSGAIGYCNGIYIDSTHVLSVDRLVHGGSAFQMLQCGRGSISNPFDVRTFDGFEALAPSYDAGVYKLAGAPVPSVPILNPRPAPSLFTQVYFAAYDPAKFPNGTVLAQDIVWGGETEIAGSTPGYDSSIFKRTEAFEGDDQYAAVVLNGGSGGIFTNLSGTEWYGQTVAGNGDNGGESTTFRMNTPEFIDWYSNALLPEPTAGGVLLIGLVWKAASRRPRGREPK